MRIIGSEAHACELDVASCGCRFHHDGYDPPDWEPCPLHAAAPALLQALRAAAQQLDIDLEGETVKTAHPMPWSIREQVYAAIALAEKGD